MTKHSSWRPNTDDDLRNAVEHVEYEVRWLTRGHETFRALRHEDSDTANLAFEAALIHCRVLLDFLCPRSNVRKGDILACEYLPGGPADGRPYAICDKPSTVLRDDVAVVRQALDGWLAHLGAVRLNMRTKPQWDNVLQGCRDMFVLFVDHIDAAWTDQFQPARAAALDT
jgi:hypothetical protein